MPYVTLPIMPVFHQLTLMDILRGVVNVPSAPVVWNETNTRTRYAEYLDRKFLRQYDFRHMTELLQSFNEKHAALFEKDRASLYDSFKIPKRSGGLRQIDAPCPELMTALRELKVLFETEFSPSRNRCSLYHTSAFAYVKGRSAKDALERHRGNKSNWFLKLDFSNFFGSTTKDFVLHMMTKVFPFSEVMKTAAGREALEQAVDLCFLNGGLPQGTPISPMLTNLIMLPIDYEMGRGLRSLEKKTHGGTSRRQPLLLHPLRRRHPDLRQAGILLHRSPGSSSESPDPLRGSLRLQGREDPLRFPGRAELVPGSHAQQGQRHHHRLGKEEASPGNGGQLHDPPRELVPQ